jgi:hypothetical protein
MNTISCWFTLGSWNWGTLKKGPEMSSRKVYLSETLEEIPKKLVMITFTSYQRVNQVVVRGITPTPGIKRSKFQSNRKINSLILGQSIISLTPAEPQVGNSRAWGLSLDLDGCLPVCGKQLEASWITSDMLFPGVSDDRTVAGESNCSRKVYDDDWWKFVV